MPAWLCCRPRAAIKAEVADPSFKIATLFGYLEERFKSKTWSVRPRCTPRPSSSPACLTAVRRAALGDEQVVLKAQMITHELMRDPDQRVLKYVSQRPRIFNVSGFRDRCSFADASCAHTVPHQTAAPGHDYLCRLAP